VAVPSGDIFFTEGSADWQANADLAMGVGDQPPRWAAAVTAYVYLTPLDQCRQQECVSAGGGGMFRLNAAVDSHRRAGYSKDI